jgi:hypothetical protein
MGYLKPWFVKGFVLLSSLVREWFLDPLKKPVRFEKNLSVLKEPERFEKT